MTLDDLNALPTAEQRVESMRALIAEKDALAENQRCRLEAVIGGQLQSLAHWRREQDRSFGELVRYKHALMRIVALESVGSEAAAKVSIGIARNALGEIDV